MSGEEAGVGINPGGINVRAGRVERDAIMVKADYYLLWIQRIQGIYLQSILNRIKFALFCV